MRKRKRYTGEEKPAILRQHLLESVAVSDICDEHGLQPTVFYRWQKQLFEQGAVVFRGPHDTEARKLQRQVAHLEELVKKNEVLGELLDGYSRYVVHWKIRESMTEADVEVILPRACAHACERFPQARPRIISDNGSQFIAKSFKEYTRIYGMTHVRTSPYYPQSNGKIERWHRSVKSECIRPATPLSLQDAQRVVRKFVAVYNTQRLHSAIGDITPKDKLDGREAVIFSERKRKPAEARAGRARLRQPVHSERLLAPLQDHSVIVA